MSKNKSSPNAFENLADFEADSQESIILPSETPGEAKTKDSTEITTSGGMLRPLSVIGFTFFISLIIANLSGFNASLVLAVFFTLCTVLFIAFKYFRLQPILALTSFAVSAACIAFCICYSLNIAPTLSLAGQTCNARLTVVDLPVKQGDKCFYTVKGDIKLPDGDVKNIKLSLYAPFKEIEPYDIICTDIKFYEPDENYKTRNLAQGIYASASAASEISIENGTEKPLRYYVLRLRKNILGAFDSNLPGEIGAVLKGIVVGDTSQIPSDLRSDFRTVGISHITAVSGLHISIIAQILTCLFIALRFGKRLSYLLSLVPVWGFALVIGFPYSAVRSVVMYTIFAVAIAVFRRSDSLNSLAMALLICGIVSPFCALDVGLLSSASSCLGIIVLSTPLKKVILCTVAKRISRFRIVDYISSALSSTFAAILGLLPCCVIYYRQVSLIALLSNIFVLPLTTAALFFGLLAGLFDFIPAVSSPLFFISGWAVKLIVIIARTFSKIPFASVCTSYKFVSLWFAGCLVLLACVVFFYKRTDKRRRLIVVFSLVCVVSLCVGAFSNALFNRGVSEIYIIDAGDCSSAVFVTGGDFDIVYEKGGYDVTAKIKTLMYSRGCRKINRVFAPIKNKNDIEELKTLNKHIAISEIIYTGNEILDQKLFSAKMTHTESNTLILNEKTTLYHDSVLSETAAVIGGFSLLISRATQARQGTITSPSVAVCTASAYNSAAESLPEALILSCERERLGIALSQHKEKTETYFTAGFGTILIKTAGSDKYVLSRIDDAF